MYGDELLRKQIASAFGIPPGLDMTPENPYTADAWRFNNRASMSKSVFEKELIKMWNENGIGTPPPALTPLHRAFIRACTHGWLDIVKAIARLDKSVKSIEALLKCYQFNQFEVFCYLLKEGHSCGIEHVYRVAFVGGSKFRQSYLDAMQKHYPSLR